MELQNLVHIVIRAYAAVSVAFGVLCLLLVPIVLLLAAGPLKEFEHLLPELTYQFALWGLSQMLLGAVLLATSGRLSRFIARKITGPADRG
jgi:hypothetical protein